MKTSEPLKTPTAKAILRSAERWVNAHSKIIVNYGNWYVGVTKDPGKRNAEHKSKNRREPAYWKAYYARSRAIALAIEKHFHDKGMLETGKIGRAEEDARHVYIFKKHLTLLD